MSTIAEIHGKAPITVAEDVLTSDVLGAMRYLTPAHGLIGWLRTVDGLGQRLPPARARSSVVCHFWPLGASRELDALLEIAIDGRVFHVVIEAKYLSGASDADLQEVEQDDDSVIVVGNQLADQLRELDLGEYTVWREGSRGTPITLSSAPEDRLLLYLTAHPTRPCVELRKSADLYPEAADRLYWASWYDVYSYLEERQSIMAACPDCLIAGDLIRLLAGKGFRIFSGVSRPSLRGVAWLDGFWTDAAVESEEAFEGIRPPSVLDVSAGAGFWRPHMRGVAGSDSVEVGAIVEPDECFGGIRPPHSLAGVDRSGFWRPQLQSAAWLDGTGGGTASKCSEDFAGIRRPIDLAMPDRSGFWSPKRG